MDTGGLSSDLGQVAGGQLGGRIGLRIGFIAVAGGTQVRLQYLWVTSDISGFACGDNLTEVQHHDPVTGRQHHPHIVLNDQHRDTVCRQRSDQIGEAAGLDVIHTCRWLIQHQQRRMRGECAGNFEPALIAIRQVTGCCGGLLAESDPD